MSVTKLYRKDMTNEQIKHFESLIDPKPQRQCALKFDNKLILYQATSLVRKSGQSLNSKPIKYCFYIAAYDDELAHKRVLSHIKFLDWSHISHTIRKSGIHK